MGRSESHQVAEQGMGQSAQDQANAQAALGGVNSSVGNYNNALNNFLRFGRATYGANGEFMRDENALANTTAAAGATALSGDLALNASRTGENTAGYAATEAESRRQSERDLTNQLATADATRLQNLMAVNQYGVEGSKFPVSAYEGIYGTSTGGAGSQLSAASGAARTPGFWDTFLPAVVQGAGTAAAGFCPCVGSMIRMADGSDKPAEELKKGEFLWPLSAYAKPIPVLETPVPVMADCYRITTDKGRTHAGSATHTLALVVGGYALMPEAAHEVVLAENETDEVLTVDHIGQQMVVPLKLGGSHIYMADGIWVLA